MRILHVTKRWPDARGGDAVVARNLVRRQREAGHRVTVLTSNCPSIRHGADVLPFGLPIDDADLDRVNFRRLVSLVGLVLRSVVLLRRLRPDVVHVHAVDLGLAVSVAARFLRIPMVLTLHGTALGSPFLSSRKQRVEGRLIRSAGYGAVLSVTEAALDDLTALGPPLTPEAVHYLPNGIVLDDFPAVPVPDAGPLLFVGRLEPVKGVDVLLRALALARGRGVDLDLRLAGSGSEEPRLRALAAELGINGNVEFLGGLDEQGVRAELAGCRGFVLPSRYEGFPLVLLEAWASGRAVVATQVGAVPRVCRDGVDALTVPADDADALAAALVRLDTDASLVARLAACGRNRVEELYSDERMADAVEEVYRDLRRTTPDAVPCDA